MIEPCAFVMYPGEHTFIENEFDCVRHISCIQVNTFIENEFDRVRHILDYVHEASIVRLIYHMRDIVYFSALYLKLACAIKGKEWSSCPSSHAICICLSTM